MYTLQLRLNLKGRRPPLRRDRIHWHEIVPPLSRAAKAIKMPVLWLEHKAKDAAAREQEAEAA